ncbi:2-phospho-L-lactate guanylyltransferase [[Eubacterium] cellulosolvens]
MSAVLIPVKKLASSKLRMASILSQNERENLVLAMLRDVLSVVSRLGHMSTYIIGVDKEVENLSKEFHAIFIRESSDKGLNHAIMEGIRYLSKIGEDYILILPADIPLIEVDDISNILYFKDNFDVILCPSKDHKGTNALLLKLPTDIQPMFGESSYQNHIKEAEIKGLKTKPLLINRIALDVDSIEELKIITQIKKEINTLHFLQKVKSYSILL